MIIGTGLFFTGSVFSHTSNNNVQPIPQQTIQPVANNSQPANDTGIEIRIISNSSWQGSYLVSYGDQNNTGFINVNGTGNRNIKIDGNPTDINLGIAKIEDDGLDLTVELVVNNTIVENQTIGNSAGGDTIDFEHVF